MQPPPRPERKPFSLSTQQKWSIVLLSLFGSLFGMFETMIIDSTFAYGRPAVGPLLALVAVVLVLGVPCWRVPGEENRHRYFSRCAVGMTVFGIFSLYMLANNIAQSKIADTKLAFTPTLIVLGVQLAVALVYLSYAHPLPPPDEMPGDKM
jgi:hypothetical protein